MLHDPNVATVRPLHPVLRACYQCSSWFLQVSAFRTVAHTDSGNEGLGRQSWSAPLCQMNHAGNAWPLTLQAT